MSSACREDQNSEQNLFKATTSALILVLSVMLKLKLALHYLICTRHCAAAGSGEQRRGGVYIHISINRPPTPVRTCYCPHFTDEKAKTRRGGMTCLIPSSTFLPLNSNCSSRVQISIFCNAKPFLTPLSGADHSFLCQLVTPPFVISWVKFNV